jgi:hypothetical protein
VNRLVARRRGSAPAEGDDAAANELLLQADDAMRDAEDDAGFIEAQFGSVKARALRDAVQAAKAELRTAFEARTKLDEGSGLDDLERRRLRGDIISRARRALDLVDEQRRNVEDLRDVERKAPELLARLAKDLDDAEARLGPAEEALKRLAAFADSVTEPISGNVAEARTRIALARAQVAAGNQAIGRNDTRSAGEQARAAEEALAQALKLLEAVTAAESATVAAQSGLAAQMADVRTAVAGARAAVSGGTATGFEAQLAQAEERLAAAERFAAGERPDPVAAARQAAQGLAVANEILAGAQQATERRAADERALTAALQSAESTFERTADFIQVRRSGVEAEARARLATAERHLELARSLAPKDPARALRNAQLAESLADAAYNAARADFTLTRSNWGNDETLSADELLRRFAGGEFNRRRKARR